MPLFVNADLIYYRFAFIRSGRLEKSKVTMVLLIFSASKSELLE